MHHARLALLVVLGTGCHLQAGLDAASRVNGPLNAMMSQSTVSRSTGVTNLPAADGGANYNVEAGFGNQTFTANSVIAVHNVTSTSFTPGEGQLAATIAANIRWSMFRWNGVTPSLAAGPARMMLLDRSTGERTWGNGIRASAGLQYKLGPIAIYGDAYHEVIGFSRGVATGTSTLEGVTIGLALQP